MAETSQHFNVLFLCTGNSARSNLGIPAKLNASSGGKPNGIPG
jgi:hypothetical protein